MSWFRERRRAQLRRREVPVAWREIVERNLPLYARLTEDDRQELFEHIQVFLDEKRFEGAGGLELNDEIRVTIAAHACVLLLHRATDYYPGLYSIIVYPSAYVASRRDQATPGVIDERIEARLGESTPRGAVVLAWDAIQRTAHDLGPCRDVVFHEFAHQLDAQNGTIDGAPVLPSRAMYATWAQILGEEFERLREEAAHGHKTLLDAYGATSPAEFFAVTTECFFTRARALRDQHPQLYEELKQFYQQDPANLPSS